MYKAILVVWTALGCILSVACMLAIPRPIDTMAEGLLVGFLLLAATVSAWLCANFWSMNARDFRQ